ncbi:hypothetical protein U1Q18_048438 [Sarracenia purpurea var. burkii]
MPTGPVKTLFDPNPQYASKPAKTGKLPVNLVDVDKANLDMSILFQDERLLNDPQTTGESPENTYSDGRRAASQDASTSRTTAAHQSGSDSEDDIPLAVRRQTKSRSVGFDPISEDEDIHQPPKEKTKKAKKVEVTDPKKPKRGPGRPRKHPLPDSAP